MTDTTNDTTNEAPTPDDEPKNPAAVLRRNRELMAELTAAKAELKAAQAAQQAAQADVATWRQRWHQTAVLDPFDAELTAAATVPSDYLKALLAEHGLLKFEPDEEGVDRPHWYTAAGELAKAPEGGAAGHLARVLGDLRGPGREWKKPWAADLERCLPKAQGTNAPGSGAYRSAIGKPAAQPVSTTPQPLPLGLR